MKKLNLFILTLFSLFSMYSQDDAIISISCDEEKMEGESFRYDFELIGGEYVSDREGNDASALKFDGEGSYIKVNTNINPSNMPKMTITFWAKPDYIELGAKENYFSMIISNHDGNNNRGIQFRKFSGFFEMAVHANDIYKMETYQDFDKWVFVAVSYDQDKKEVVYFMDGKFGKYKPVKSNGGQTTFNIGASITGNRSYKGLLDDINVYNGALTEKEIGRLYREYGERVPKNTQYYYKKDVDIADVVVRVGDIDYSGFSYPKGFNIFCEKNNFNHAIPKYANLKDYPGTDKIHIPTSYKKGSDNRHDGYSGTNMSKNTDTKDVVIKYPKIDFEIKNIEIQITLDDFQTIRRKQNEMFQVKIDGKRMRYVEKIFKQIQIGTQSRVVHFGILPQDLKLFADGQVTINIDDPVSGLGDGYIIDFIQILINPKESNAECSSKLYGYVKDGLGQPILDALVSANSMTEALTNEEGYYELKNVPIGVNILKIDHQKFISQDREVELYLDSKNKEIDFNLTEKEQEDVDFVAEIKETGSVNLYGVYFESNGSIPKPESDSTLQHLADFINSNPDIKIEVIGHTDDVGNDEFNLNLSQKRAESVLKWLQDKSVNIDKVIAKGLGEQYPVASNKTDIGKGLNRRVELRIIK